MTPYQEASRSDVMEDRGSKENYRNEPLPSHTVDLRAIYKSIYYALPWPESIPSPEEVTFRWKRRITRVLGSCYPYKKIIKISPLYKDGRLRGEVKDLMTHEASHFIWHGHPVAFKSFLQSVGVAPHYICRSSPPSAAFQVVYAEQSLLPYIWMCPACGATHSSVDGHLDVCCERCARRWDPQLRLPFGEGFARLGSAWPSVSDSPSYVSSLAAPPHFLNPSKTKKEER